MGLFDFVRDAGKMLGFGDDEQDTAAANQAMAEGLAAQVRKNGLAIEDLAVSFQDGVATVSGVVESQVDREKVILVVGNTQGVAQVDDRIELKPRPQATFYTVQRGDTLSAIAKDHYGNAMKYPVIFEANKPMLEDPDKIYPGQVLRIPPLDD